MPCLQVIAQVRQLEAFIYRRKIGNDVTLGRKGWIDRSICLSRRGRNHGTECRYGDKEQSTSDVTQAKRIIAHRSLPGIANTEAIFLAARRPCAI